MGSRAANARPSRIWLRPIPLSHALRGPRGKVDLRLWPNEMTIPWTIVLAANKSPAYFDDELRCRYYRCKAQASPIAMELMGISVHGGKFVVRNPNVRGVGHGIEPAKDLGPY
jgi:hypothetical protein